MSEEKKKTILNYLRNPQSSKIGRIVTFTALLTGITTFLGGILIIPLTLLMKYIPDVVFGQDIVRFIFRIIILPLILFWPIAGTGLVLSIVMFFVERDKPFRLLPLKLVLTGLLLFFVLHFVYLYIRHELLLTF